MSTILVNTLTGTSTAGSISVTGEGNSTTTNLQQGLAKAWIYFNASGPVTNGSFNVSSLADDDSPQITNDMSGEGYCPLYTSSGYHELIGNDGGTSGTIAGSYRILGRNSSNSSADTGRVSAAVFGDLA